MQEKGSLPVSSLPAIHVSFEASNGQVYLEKIARPKIDPIRFPPLRDVYYPKQLEEAVRFSPLTGEVFVFGKHGKDRFNYIDKLTLTSSKAHEQVWFEFKNISDAYGFCKDLYLRRGLSNIVDYTEDLVQRVIPFLPQITSDPLNEKKVKELFTGAFDQLIKPRNQLPSLAEEQDLELVLNSLMHNWRGIRRQKYPEFLTRSHLGSVFLDAINDILNYQNRGDDFSITLATLLIEQYTEKAVMDDIALRLSRGKDVVATFQSVQKTRESLHEIEQMLKFEFFKVAPYRNFAAYILGHLRGIDDIKKVLFRELLGEELFEEIKSQPMPLLKFIDHYRILPDLSPVIERVVHILNKLTKQNF